MTYAATENPASKTSAATGAHAEKRAAAILSVTAAAVITALKIAVGLMTG